MRRCTGLKAKPNQSGGNFSRFGRKVKELARIAAHLRTAEDAGRVVHRESSVRLQLPGYDDVAPCFPHHRRVQVFELRRAELLYYTHPSHSALKQVAADPEFFLAAQCFVYSCRLTTFQTHFRLGAENIHSPRFRRRSQSVIMILSVYVYPCNALCARSAVSFRRLVDQATANLLLSLMPLPYLKSTNIPMVHSTMKPARRLTPPSIPMPRNIGLEKRTAANANKLLDRLLAEKMLAAYRG